MCGGFKGIVKQGFSTPFPGCGHGEQGKGADPEKWQSHFARARKPESQERPLPLHRHTPEQGAGSQQLLYA